MLSLNDSQSILGLSNLMIKNIFIIENITTFEVEMIRKPHKCPCCSTMTNRIHDYRLQKIKDLPSFKNKDDKQAVNLMLYTSPKLVFVHAFKEAFFVALKSKTRLEALSTLTTWIIHAENSNLPRFVSVTNTLNNWFSGILNSFETSYTNGFTEGTNNTIKVLKRNTFGYSNFNRFRNRILYIDYAKNR